MNTREGAPAALQGRELQEAALESFQKQVACASLLVAAFHFEGYYQSVVGATVQISGGIIGITELFVQARCSDRFLARRPLQLADQIIRVIEVIAERVRQCCALAGQVVTVLVGVQNGPAAVLQPGARQPRQIIKGAGDGCRVRNIGLAVCDPCASLAPGRNQRQGLKTRN